MAKFEPKFKEGSLVNVSFEGIVVEVMLGADEGTTWYRVFTHHVEGPRQFKSRHVSERGE